MSKGSSELIGVGELRVGMFVELGIGWMAHPFPTGSFRISSGQQIETIRSLGLAQVRYFPHRSDPGVASDSWVATPVDSMEIDSEIVVSVGEVHSSSAPLARQDGHQAGNEGDEQRRQLRCERRFQETVAAYRLALEQAQAQPQMVRSRCQTVLASLVKELLVPGDVAIRLLASTGGGRPAAHAANVTVLSLLLGRAMGLSPAELAELGAAAFFHDIGKSLLPERVRSFDDYFSVAEYKVYQDHVPRSVELGQTLGLSSEALTAVAQHHELIDGSGFPRKSKGDELGRLGRILAVVNRYDNLCNPANPTAALTPHEALSSIYTQMKGRFDGNVVHALIRVVGVYPPGTVIQLTNERYAMVMAANASRSLKPRVLIHDPGVPRHEAMILDLQEEPDLRVRRGIKPANLPLESADYLMPRQRICYFFEHVQPERLAA